jgi:serine/threonine-protein kinase
MRQLTYGLFIVLLAIVTIFIFTTANQLPESIATHFGADGLPTIRRISRTNYLLLISGMTFVTPLTLIISHQLLHQTPERFNIPNRDYWLAPERRAATIAFLRIHIRWLACITVSFIGALYSLVLKVNTASPARSPSGYFLGILIAFFMLSGLWFWILYARFRKPF